MASAKDGEAIQYIGEGSGGDFQFSPDGRYLSLVREVDDESSQLFLMPTSGGEAVQLTNHHGGIGAYQWTDDSSTIIFSADEPRSEEEEKEHKLGADPVFVDEGPNGKEEERFSNLWAFDLKSETETRLSEEDFIVYDFDVSPDGSRIALVGAPNNRVNSEHLTELYVLEVDSKKLTRLTHNESPEAGPLWAPDGKTFAYRAASDEKFELHNGYFWIMNLDTGSSRKLQGQHLGMLDGTIAWTRNGEELLFTEQRRTHTNLYKLNVKTDKTTALTKFAGTLSALSFSKDRKHMIVRYEDISTPADLYVSKLGSSPITSLKEAVRLTDANPWVREELQLAQGENLLWNSKGGMEIEGVFIPALNHSGGKMPLILEVHGGPAYFVKNEFRGEYQVLAGLGYAILGPNVRGSTGYGDELLRGLMGEVGDGEFIDQMTGVDYVIAHKNIDPDRLGIRGWSWGGVSVSYTITQTQRFKAASIGAMVGNWAAETGPGFNLDVALWYIGGTPWDNPEEWARRSSITHVKNITTPSIIFHGGNDTQSSVGQALMFFTALRDIGKAPVRYIKFPRQGHGVREPRLNRISQIEEIKWFKKYIDGENWQAWVRAESVERNKKTTVTGQ
jgi:dipeptidyl aminopeptidase/acylaminoacyl peptidase